MMSGLKDIKTLRCWSKSRKSISLILFTRIGIYTNGHYGNAYKKKKKEKVVGHPGAFAGKVSMQPGR